MITRIAVLSVVVASLSLAVAATASEIKYDYDREVDFSKWARAAWRSTRILEPSMTEKRLAKAVESGFQGRGYTLVDDRTQADFLIEYRAATWQDVEVGETFRGPAFGRSLYVDRTQMGALVINVYDRPSGKLVWRGVVSDAVARDPEKADKRTAKAVEKLLKKFPAQEGGK